MHEWHAEEVKKDYLSPEVPELFSATCWTSLLSEPQQLHCFIFSQMQLSLAVASLGPRANVFAVFGTLHDQ